MYTSCLNTYMYTSYRYMELLGIGHIRPLSWLAVNFTIGLAFSRLRPRLSHDFHGDGSL